MTNKLLILLVLLFSGNTMFAQQKTKTPLKQTVPELKKILLQIPAMDVQIDGEKSIYLSMNWDDVVVKLPISW